MQHDQILRSPNHRAWATFTIASMILASACGDAGSVCRGLGDNCPGDGAGGGAGGGVGGGAGGGGGVVPEPDAGAGGGGGTIPDPGAGGGGGSIPDPDEELPTGTPEGDEVRINETLRYQAVDGVGTCAYAYPWANDIGWSRSSVTSAFEELDIEYVRLASWFNFWEPTNDNGDPNTTNWSAFDPQGIISAHDVPFAQYLTGRGIDVELGIWSPGDFMVSGGQVPASMYRELGESVAAYTVNMEENGVPQRVTEVQNEPGINAQIKYPSPEALRDAALAILDGLDRAGQDDILLHGPNYHAPAPEVSRWAEVWLGNDRLAARTAAVSYHTWWYDNFEAYDAIRQVAEAHDKPVWATEMGFCAIPDGCGNGHFLRPNTWETAWDYAMSYYRAFAWSHASRVYHWTLVGFDAAVDPATGARFPSFYALKHFANFIPKDARMLDVASGDANVLALAFLLPNGERTAILLNTGSGSRTVSLTSVAGAELSVSEAVTTRQGSYDQPATVSASGGDVEVTLPAQSMTSVRLTP